MFKNTCPECGGDLIVVEATLVQTGETIYPNSPLYSDGFVMDELLFRDDIEDHSTEGERTRCEDCGREAALELE
jgi:hypothetical protein